MIAVKIKATFAGQSGNLGYINGKSYHLLLMQKKDKNRVSVQVRFQTDNSPVKPAPVKYESLFKFFQNWKDVSSEDNVVKEKELTIFDVATRMVKNLTKGEEFEKEFTDECKAVLISPLMNYIVSNDKMPTMELAELLSEIREEFYIDEDYRDLADAILSIKQSIINKLA